MSQHLLTGIGKRIRALRKERKVTLTDLAQQAGVSKGLVSKIENGRTVPSLPVLLSLMKALGLEPEEFFRGLHFGPPQRYLHRKFDETTIIEKEEGSKGFIYRHILDEALRDFSIEAVLLDIEPGAERGLVTTDAYEFKYVLQGEINYQIDQEFIQMQKGDTLFYDGRQPHVPHNSTDQPARMLVVYLYPSNQNT